MAGGVHYLFCGRLNYRNTGIRFNHQARSVIKEAFMAEEIKTKRKPEHNGTIILYYHGDFRLDITNDSLLPICIVNITSIYIMS